MLEIFFRFATGCHDVARRPSTFQIEDTTSLDTLSIAGYYRNGVAAIKMGTMDFIPYWNEYNYSSFS